MGIIAMLLGEEPNPLQKLLNYENKGQYGEFLIEYALGKNNISGYRKILRNVYIPYKEHTAEIDVLMIHEKGIFVFESKNFNGSIFGGIDQLKWTQRLSYRITNQFYNPVKQNFNHCKALGKFLKIDHKNIFSYIVFSDKCVFNNIPENTCEYTIVHRHQLLRFLRKDLNTKTVVLSVQQVDSSFDKLNNECNTNNAKHIEYIINKTEGRICPYCDSQLVQRTGRYGPFLGCYKYPKCKFTRNIE